MTWRAVSARPQEEADLITTTFWGVFTLSRFVAAALTRVRPAPLLAGHLAVLTASLMAGGVYCHITGGSLLHYRAVQVDPQ